MILHILLKTTLLLLFVTSSQAPISAFNCTSHLNESPSLRGFFNTDLACCRGVRLLRRDLRYINYLLIKFVVFYNLKKKKKLFNQKPPGFDWRLNGIGDIRDVTTLNRMKNFNHRSMKNESENVGEKRGKKIKY